MSLTRIGFGAVLLPSIVCAQSESAVVCTALLEHGIANVISYSSEYDYLTVIKDNYCSSSFSSLSKSKQDSFELSIKKLPLKYSGGHTKTQEQHEYFCREYGNLQSGAGQSRYSAATLYDKAIDAWRDCVSLAIGGTAVKPSVTPDQKVVDFTLAVTRGQAEFTGVDTTNMACVLDGGAVGATASVSLSSVSKSLRCERQGFPLEFNSSTMQFFPSANVKVKTTTGDYRVDLYEMIDGPANDRIGRLEAEIAALRLATSAATNDLKQVGQSRDGADFNALAPRAGGGQPVACPPGTFVSMIQASESVHGNAAVDGIKRITFRCSPVIAKPAVAVGAK